ncbi:maturation protein [ssRNA phage Gerhypos.4_44]|uniref:Maturation protein n=2 Tax=Leviviricetes TaxID=2842243 RepID=A0A8S5L367_9VIRU|nr:maturation protein [ssRNA phage Gerhypos.4_44]QDH91110.1 MAG: hypothetical protein H4Bulk46757_000003 [Leviviridae sp.]DAD51610.1 TPA_asm: maturation protein [ssRNA phage Gerhypos.4_44]
MPYYKEGKVNEWLMSRWINGTTQTIQSPFIKSMVEMTSYRSSGPKMPYSEFVPDHLADPYAYFLNTNRDRKFDQALKARGLESWILPEDSGHSLYLRKREFIGTPYSGFLTRSGQTIGIENGVLYPLGYTGALWDDLVPADYKNVAQQLYVSAAPKSEMFDLANFLGELREGLPHVVSSLMRDKANVFRGLGSDYLNVQFGWIPFVNDLINAGLALKTATEALINPSRIVRRHRQRKPLLTSSEVTATSARMKTLYVTPARWMASQIGFPFTGDWSGLSFGNNLGGSHYVGTVTKVERWFDGEFVQLPKVGFDPDDYFSRLDQLINLKLTPEVLWNLAPWSWLVDWHLRIGDSIASNLLVADDRVHSVYAYAMQRTTKSEFLSSKGITPASGYSYSGPSDWGAVLRTGIKQRVRANPYGFTAGGADALNNSQIAILAALGLTKVGR